MKREDGYLFTKINYGGEIITRGELYRRLGLKQADAWLMGYDRACFKSTSTGKAPTTSST
jgi:hypothetical protein